MRICPAVVAIGFASALAAQQAHADTTTILLVTDPSSERVMKRIRAELEAAGFVVVTRPSAGDSVNRHQLLDEARRVSAMAAVRVKPEGAGAELWVVDRVTEKTLLRDAPNGGDDAQLATKTTELLRASLIEVRLPSFRPTEVRAPKSLETFLPALVPEPNPKGFVSVGATLLQAGSIGTFVLVAGGIHVPLSDQFAGGLRLGIPVTRTTLEGAEGHSEQALAYARSELQYLPLGQRVRWSPLLGIVVGGAWFHTSGSALEPYTPESNSVLSMLAGANFGMVARLNRSLALRGEGAAMVAVPRSSVSYAGTTVARIGFPVVEIALALQLTAW